MLEDLRVLLSYCGSSCDRQDYSRAIVDANILGKPSKKARELSARHLSSLYDLSLSNPIFRALRALWACDEEAQPMLALAAALARDPLLRATQSFILQQPIGGVVSRDMIENLLSQAFPSRFSAASLKSFAQNIGGTWTSSGFLEGRARKVRTRPVARPASLTFLLFLGYLTGRSGQRLFCSEWTDLLESSTDELESLANAGSHRGLLVFMNAGGVKEVRFPGYLSPEEERIREEVSRVN